MQQLSPEWFEARRGVSITASNVGAVVGRSPFKKRREYLREKVRERHGIENEQFDSPAMKWGRENEEQARRDAEAELNLDITEVGLIIHPDHEWLGASPDGLSEDSGIVEIKCPYKQELFSINDRPDYYLQMQCGVHLR
jgi:exodeoxyribonuclease (lambda-induced)